MLHCQVLGGRLFSKYAKTHAYAGAKHYTQETAGPTISEEHSTALPLVQSRHTAAHLGHLGWGHAVCKRYVQPGALVLLRTCQGCFVESSLRLDSHPPSRVTPLLGSSVTCYCSSPLSHLARHTVLGEAFVNLLKPQFRHFESFSSQPFPQSVKYLHSIILYILYKLQDVSS